MCFCTQFFNIVYLFVCILLRFVCFLLDYQLEYYYFCLYILYCHEQIQDYFSVSAVIRSIIALRSSCFLANLRFYLIKEGRGNKLSCWLNQNNILYFLCFQFFLCMVEETTYCLLILKILGVTHAF